MWERFGNFKSSLDVCNGDDDNGKNGGQEAAG